MHYYAIIDQEDGLFGVVFPDFPGCVTSGETIEEALECAREALALHVEGMEQDGDVLPAPSEIANIRDNDEWYSPEDIIAAVPLIRQVGKTVRIGLSIDKGILAAIDDEARRRGLTRSAYMVGASVDQI